MAVVRELVTLLTTEANLKGLEQYERGLEKVKEIALGVGAALGIAFSLEKIGEFINSLVESGQEVMKIRAQIANLARPMDDVNAAMDETFNIAQKTGIAYTEVVDRFRDFLQVSRESKISQEELLAATENVYKAVRVDRSSKEQQDALFSAIRRAEVLGKAGPRVIGMLAHSSASALQLLERFFKTDEEGLRALAKAGKITGEELVKALGTASPELDKKFAHVPWTIGRAWQYARNEMVLTTTRFLQITQLTVRIGTAIKWTTDAVVGFAKSLGDMSSVLRVVGIALALVFGPGFLAMMITATAAVVAFAAPWAPLVLAITGVAIAIEDLVGWMQGKKSVIGTWVGPFKDLAENFKQLDIFAGFRVFGDIFKGDWSAAWKDMKLALTDTKAIVLEISAAVAVVTAGFTAWKILEFSGLISAIEKVISTIRGVPPAAKEAEAAVKNISATKNTGIGGKAANENVPGGIGKPANENVAMPGPRAPWAGGLAYGLNALNMFGLLWQQHQDALAGKEIDRPLDTMMKTDIGKRIEDAYQRYKTVARDTLLNAPAAAYKRTMEGPPEIKAESDAALKPKAKLSFADWDKPPSMAPGVLAPAPTGPVTNNTGSNNTFTQNVGGINVTTTLDAEQIGRVVGDKVGQLGAELFSGMARDVARSAPRTEAATQ